MKKCLLAIALTTSANLCPAEQTHLHCTTLRDAGKVFTFEIDVDRTKNAVFVDGQYTTEAFVSDHLISFVLADGNTGYAFDIYGNGRLIATHRKDHSTLFMQCS